MAKKTLRAPDVDGDDLYVLAAIKYGTFCHNGIDYAPTQNFDLAHSGNEMSEGDLVFSAPAIASDGSEHEIRVYFDSDEVEMAGDDYGRLPWDDGHVTEVLSA